MAATVTLPTTTLGAPVGPSDVLVKVASTDGILRGYRLYVDRELMEVQGFSVDPWVQVRRGVDGTASAPHASGVTIYIGQAHQFYTQDPVGRPDAAVLVSPYINVVNGTVWFARGDAVPSATANRWWQLQTSTPGEGPLGIRTTTLDPTTST